MQAESSTQEQSRTPRTIYVVDDHAVVRLGFSTIVRRAPDLVIGGSASSAERALQDITRDPPELVVVDLRLDDLGGLELIEELNARDTSSRILVVSMHQESLYAERALELGAMGYLMKSEDGDAFLRAVRAVLDGRIYLSEKMRNRLLQNRDLTASSERPLGAPRLSPREQEVFTLIGQGRSSAEIAEILSVSVKTVGTHRRHIQEKLGIEKKERLRVYAVLWQQELV